MRCHPCCHGHDHGQYQCQYQYHDGADGDADAHLHPHSNRAYDMLPPKLRNILGCLAFTEFCFVKNNTLPRSNHFLKIQTEIHFQTFKALTKTLKKKFNWKYGVSHLKSTFRINFRLR